MKRKSMITMLVIALMLVLSLTVLSACGKNNDDNKDDPPATYSVTVTNGTGGGEYAEGATVKIKANAPETGKEFTSWTINGVSVDDKTKAEITFTMPANAVTATANYGDVLYEFALENCTADKETAKFGEEVTFTADEIIGKRFDSWNIKGVDDLTGLDLTKSPLTFTMPANDINVAAVLEDIDYTVTVTGGTTDKETAHYGDTVTITANEPETGKEFGRWEITGLDTSGLELSNAELTFTMPASEVTATARYSYIDYKVTVVGGTAQVDADAEPTSEVLATYECPVSIFADTAPTGQRFVRWTSADGVVFDDETSEETTFTMPDKDVTVTAVFEYIDYTVSVTGGTAQVNGGVASASVKAHYGDSITITANAPETGKKFKNWTIEGIGASGWNLTQSKLVFKMSTGNVTATANYEFIDYTVTVVGGTANKTTAHYGDSITITAAAPETGKRFTGWTIEGVTVEDNTIDELTFTMPAGNVTATANYDFINYTVTVNGGTANKTTARYGDSITITAAAPETGKRFTGWTLEGVTVENTSVDELTFTMPAGNVTATANYDFIDYTVTVVGGTANKTTAHYGDSITITAEIPTGMSFAGWTLEGVTAQTGGFSINFTMPANNVTATAKYVYNNYNVTVNGGTAQVNDGVASASVKAHYGEEVTITAEVPVGKEFVMWSFEGLAPDGLEITNPQLTFTMPANGVTATAELRDLVKSSVTVQGGVAQVGDGTLMTSLEAYCGDTVTLTAYQDPDKTFVKWTIEGIDTEGLDLTQRVLTFTMPENDVTATAEFENVPTDLTFEGDVATSGELWYVNYDSKSFRLPLGSGQDSCTYTIKLSNPAFTFKVYGSDGEVYIDDNGEGVKSITIDREDNYTIEVINTGTAANCTLTVTQI